MLNPLSWRPRPQKLNPAHRVTPLLLRSLRFPPLWAPGRLYPPALPWASWGEFDSNVCEEGSTGIEEGSTGIGTSRPPFSCSHLPGSPSSLLPGASRAQTPQCFPCHQAPQEKRHYPPPPATVLSIFLFYFNQGVTDLFAGSFPVISGWSGFQDL